MHLSGLLFTPAETIRQFFLRALFWLVLVLLCWYVLVPLLHWPIRWFLSGMALLGVPEFVTGVHQTLTGFEFQTNLSPGAASGQPFRPDAVIAVAVDARLYSYGSALMAALTLAAWERDRWRHLTMGWLILLPFQMLAVYAVGMKQIVIDGGPAVAAQTDWAGWQIEAIAYLYQFSTLIMPPVTAIAVWLVLHKRFVERFVGADVLALIRKAAEKPSRTA
ncbi:MAG: exosortase H-associated membrane protein [Casimicrobiaceae bacterium]